MADTIAKYVVALEAQVSKYTAELEKANRRTEEFHKRQVSAVANIKKAFQALGGLYAVSRAASFIQSQVSAADAIGEMAAAAGIGASQLQELQIAFGKLTASSQSTVNRALQTFTVNLGKARDGSKELAEAFADVGVSLSGSASQTLDQTLVALAGIQDETDRAARAAQFFGQRFGPQLAGALGNGIEALESMRQQARSTGQVLSDEMVQRASDLSDKFDDLKKVISTQTANAVLENADALSTLATAMGKVVSVAVDGVSAITTFFQNVGKGVGALVSGDIGGLSEFESGGVVAGRGTIDRGGARGGGSTKGIEAEVERALDLSNKYGDALAKQREASESAAEAEREAMEEAIRRQVQIREAVEEGARVRQEKLEDEIEKALEVSEQYGNNIQRMTEKTTESMRAYADEAARAIQSALADYLFDPFEDGLKGMLMGFIDMLRRMAAEAAAAKILEAIGGSGGWIGAVAGFISGQRADGGPVAGGRAYLVGERGPELFVPGASGAILPNAGGVNIVQNIDARGASDPAQTMRAMKIAKDQAKAEMMDLMRRGKFA